MKLEYVMILTLCFILVVGYGPDIIAWLKKSTASSEGRTSQIPKESVNK